MANLRKRGLATFVYSVPQYQASYLQITGCLIITITLKPKIMLSFLKMLAVMSASALLPMSLHAGNIDNTPVAKFDLSRYLGTWYEIARYDHSFERGMTDVSAEYILRDDGKIDVINSGCIEGKSKTAHGKAKQPDPETEPALLRVSFFMFFYSDYRILMIDDDYTTALVGSSNDNYLWILSRTPNPSQDTINKYAAEARHRGYDTTHLIKVPQSHHR